MFKGWFIGNFEPSTFKTDQFEVAIKRYAANSVEPPHFHKISTEYTLIVSGKAEINGHTYNEDDIIVIAPGEVSSFKTLTDVITCVVKYPSSSDDKYIVD